LSINIGIRRVAIYPVPAKTQVDEGEPHLQRPGVNCSKTGYVARQWAHVAALDAGIGYSTKKLSCTSLVIAPDFVAISVMSGEFMENIYIEPQEAVEMVGRGEITDTKTAFFSLLWLDKFQHTLL
jgi:hypothetical protein